MNNDAKTLEDFFKNSDLTPEKTKSIITQGLKGSDYGEFYQESRESETILKDKGAYKQISSGNSQSGFGFRVGQKERVGYSYSDIFNAKALNDAVKQSRQVLKGHSGIQQTGFGKAPQKLYSGSNPVTKLELAEKIAKIDEIEAYVMSLSKNIKNVTIQYSAASKDVHIITADGQSMIDKRPTAHLSLSITVEGKNGKLEIGSSGVGGRTQYKDLFNDDAYQAAAKMALKQAETLLIAKEAPAGIMDVVLNQGWPAVLLHEAVGHGLEGDFNRAGISVYSGKVGQQIAAKGVTVVDQGDLVDERGSLHFDDEGTPTQQNILIEDGILKGYMHDRQNAQLTGVPLTGNGRRESYDYAPIPRMTNTYFANGKYEPGEIIASVKDGLYISDMGGGSVNITSGKFNMKATLAHRIRNGKLCEPIKGATLVGDGLTVMKSISMVANDLTIAKASGMCGKNGQQVPVGCGQPTIRVANMTIGGTGKK